MAESLEALGEHIANATAGAVLAVIVAVRRGRLRQSVGRSIELVTTAGGNVAQIDDPRANSRFAYAPAIAVGAFVAGAWA